jgi:hypothetical protein
MAFDPDQYLSQSESKPASGGFDPDAYLSKPTGSTGRGALSVGGEAFARGLPGTGTFIGTASAASAFLAGPALPAVAAISAATGPAAPFVAGAIEIGGPILAGMLGAYGVTSAVEKMNSFLDPVGYAKWEQAKKEQPTAELAGSFASGFAGSSWRTAPQVAQAGASALKKFATSNLGQRTISSGAMGGLDAAQQYAQTGTIDPKMVAASAAGGFALPGLNPAGKLASGLGAATVNAFKKKPPGTSGDVPERPPADASPEETAKYLSELKERSKKRDETAPLTEAAIRNKETGEIKRMGPKHDQERKDATKDTHEEGFVDERGNFHERMAAIDQAKRSGQLPEDFVPREPTPGERPGLHSGDLRDAKDPRFEVTEEQPAGVPKPEAPAFDPNTASREDYKKEHGRILQEAEGHNIKGIEALLTGDKAASTHWQNLADKAIAEANQLKDNMPPVEFANKEKPTWEEMHEHLWGTKTVGQALDKTLDAGLGTKGQRLLLKALNQLSGVRDASITYSKDLLKYKDAKGLERQDAHGLYYSTEHRVEMGKNGDLYVLLHESIHAGTSRLLHDGSSAAAKALNSLYKKYKLQEDLKLDALRDKHQDIWDQVTSTPGIKISEIEPTFKELVGYKDSYGFTDVHEFVAEAFTNKDFMRLLKEAEPTTVQPKGVIKNLWDEFKEVVRTGLNIPENAKTALDEVLEAGQKALETQEGQHKAEKAEIAKQAATPDYEPPQASMRPVELDDTVPPKYLYHGTRKEDKVLFDKDGNLILTPAKNFGGKTTSVSLTHDQNVANDYAARVRGGGPNGFNFNNAKTIKIHSDALPEGISRESGEEWAFNTDKPIVIPKGKFEVIDHPLSKSKSFSHKEFYEHLVENHGKYETESIFGSGQEWEKRHEWLKAEAEGDPYLKLEEDTRAQEAQAHVKEIEKLNKLSEDRAKGTYKEPSVEWNIKNSKELPQAARMSEQIAKDLGEEGIPITHDSPIRHEGMFNWRKWLLKGEGAAAFGAGTYFSTGEKTHSWYRNQFSKGGKESKSPAYHGVLKVEPHELLDWNATQQSDLVNKAFETLGIKTKKEIGPEHELAWSEMEKKAPWNANMYEGLNKNKDKFWVTEKSNGKYELFDVSNTNSYYFDTFQQAKEHAKTLIKKGDTGGELYNELVKKYTSPDPGNFTTSDKLNAKKEAQMKASDELSKLGVVGNVHNSMGGKDSVHRNYVMFDDSPARVKTLFTQHASVSKETKPTEHTTGSETVDKVAHGIDVRTIPNKESFYEHATDILEKHGEEVAIKFLEDYKTEVSKRQIPVAEDLKGLDDMFHKMDTWSVADESERVMHAMEAKKAGVTKEMLEQWFFDREDGRTSPEMEKWLADGDSELAALVKKAKGMGLDIGEEFTKGQSRIRIQGGVTSSWKKVITEFFANKTPLGEKIAEKADAAHERKVFGIEGTDRVVEIHRVDKDQTLKYKDDKGVWRTKDVKRGTEVWEWRDGVKTKIGHSDDIELSPKSASNLIKTLDGKDTFKLGDARVQDIETHSPYRYLHDAIASQSLAIMGLRKYVRDAEAMQKLTESPLFKEIGHGPTEDLKTLPKGWVVPASIDRIPQLRGWHFDPKAAAIVEDFAKVWENNMILKLSNQLVKNMMLNPIPHMFNEAMHLWNARGFTGWVNPLRMAEFVRTANKAWNDVGNQTEFYREVMREGGSILGATPRNNYFTELINTAGKELRDNAETNTAITRYAKKTGTTTIGAYNALSKYSQQAMWFTRDVMYMQYMHETMNAYKKKTGETMPTKEAIEHVEKHMPNYRMPSEVLGSRGLAKVLKNPNITMFSRYHYGMVKSLVNTLRDINPKNLASPEGRQDFKKGADTMLAIGVAMGVLYPVMDSIAEAIFGMGAEQRRAGPFHLIQAAMDVSSGKKDASALLWPMVSFNPVLAVGLQLLLNKKMFSGKSIYHPNDTLGEKTSDAGTYLLSQVPQAPPIMSAMKDEGGGQSFVAKQLDIKAQTPEQRKVIDRAKKREEIARKSRETKRQKGTYKP